ncbi:hypothetical protein C8J57DRAFT_1708494 [Mycena rebaudengoi]|nr:hypothetical protein C8J57DRAFT_1708494 [Mycena rebaudengoi]
MPKDTSGKLTVRSTGAASAALRQPRVAPASPTLWQARLRRTATTALATAKGPSISRSGAMSKFKLKAAYLNQIKPVEERPNKRKNAKTATTPYYNLCDVQALANEVERAERERFEEEGCDVRGGAEHF